MKTKKSFIFDKIALFILVFFPIYQDSPLVFFMGAAGYSLMLPLSFLFLAIYLVKNVSFPRNKRLLDLLKLGVLLAVVSFISMGVWVFLRKSIFVLDENIILKTFKGLIQYFSYIAYISVLLIIIRHVGTYFIGLYSFVVVLSLTVVCFVERITLPYAFSWLHCSGSFPYYRIRLLTTESSWTAMMVFVYSMLSSFWAFENKKRNCLVLSLVCSLILILTTGSKTLIVAVLLTFVGLFILATNHLTKKKVMLFFPLLLLVMVVLMKLLPTLLEAILNDLLYFTSIATRFYTIFIGLIIGIRYPFGVGCGVYVGILQEYLRKYLSLLSTLKIKLNTSEIVALAYGTTDTNLAVKSGLFHYNMFWGIIGTVVLLYNFWLVIKSLKKNKSRAKNLLLVTFCVSVFLISFAQSWCYEFWLMYAFILGIVEQNKACNGMKVCMKSEARYQ